MIKENPIICFLGAGNMAEAIIKGLISGGTAAPSRIIVTDPLQSRLEYLAETYGIKTRTLNTEAVRASDVVFITVKPHHVSEVLQEIAPEFNKKTAPNNNGKKLIISIAAGINTTAILQALKEGGLTSPIPSIVRAMPNIPVTVGEGMTALTAGAGAGAEDLCLAQGLFKSVGNAVILDDEGLLDAVTALSGSGPAYFFYFMEALVEAGIKAGLPADKARTLVLQTAMGAAAMSIQSDCNLSELRKKVTSPGGTTEAALKIFSASDFKVVVEKALTAAEDRSRELSENK